MSDTSRQLRAARRRKSEILGRQFPANIITVLDAERKGYYFADPLSRQIFWLEPVEESFITEGVRECMSKGQLSMLPHYIQKKLIQVERIYHSNRIQDSGRILVSHPELYVNLGILGQDGYSLWSFQPGHTD